MHTPIKKLDYLYFATEISEWIERNYGYFVNKNSDKIKIIKDFAEQLERLPVEAMSYIQQAKNNIIDSGDTHPPLSVNFIKELKNILNKEKKLKKNKNDFIKIFSKDALGNCYCYTRTLQGKLIGYSKNNQEIEI